MLFDLHSWKNECVSLGIVIRGMVENGVSNILINVLLSRGVQSTKDFKLRVCKYVVNYSFSHFRLSELHCSD